MNDEDAFGFVIRSRHQELAERERASLYHLNREMKKGNRGSIDKLAKIVGDERVIVSERSQIEEMAVGFFKSLFQGHHRSSGSISTSPFTPDFAKLDDFLVGVGKLSNPEKEAMVVDVSLSEVENAIKAAP